MDEETAMIECPGQTEFYLGTLGEPDPGQLLLDPDILEEAITEGRIHRSFPVNIHDQ